MEALLELVRVRVLLLLRQPEILFWAFGFPVLLSIVLGLAFRDAVTVRSRVAVLDGPRAAELRASLGDSADVEVERATDRDAAERRLVSGAVDLLIVPQETPELRGDPARAEAELARARVHELLQRSAGRTDPLALADVRAKARGSRYIDWFFPGLLGLSVMSTSVWAVGFALVDARQKRLLRRLLATPMRRSSFLLAHVLARCVVLGLEVLVLGLFARFVLGVPFRGSLAALGVLCLAAGLVFSGIGVLLGSRARTVEAAAGLINLAMMPMGLASGTFFAYERFADVLQPVVRILPLAALNDGLRAVMLEGRGLADLGTEILILAVWGAGSFLAGLALFRWD